MHITSFTSYDSKRGNLADYVAHLRSILNESDFSQDQEASELISDMVCTTTDLLDRHSVFPMMLESGLVRALFAPDSRVRPKFRRLVYATDHNPNDPIWIGRILDAFTGDLTVVHVHDSPNDLARDVFIQHSEHVAQELESTIRFRLVRGQNQARAFLDIARKEDADLLFIPYTKRAIMKNLEGGGFVNNVLNETDIPVVVFQG